MSDPKQNESQTAAERMTEARLELERAKVELECAQEIARAALQRYEAAVAQWSKRSESNTGLPGLNLGEALPRMTLGRI
jgi:hypothetical protein